MLDIARLSHGSDSFEFGFVEGETIFENPPELIAVVDIGFPSNPGGDVCLIPKHLAFCVDLLAARRYR